MNVVMALELAGTGCPSGLLARQAVQVLAAEVRRLQAEVKAAECRAAAPFFAPEESEPEVYDWP